MTTDRCANCHSFGKTPFGYDPASLFCTAFPEHMGDEEGYSIEQYPHGVVMFSRTTTENSCQAFKKKRNQYCQEVGRS